MKVVVDANILFAALIKNNHTRHLLLHPGLELYVPEYLFDEIKKHIGTLTSKTGLSGSEVSELLDNLLSIGQIQTLAFEDFQKLLPKAESISPDLADAPYLALCLLLRCPLWSNDARLKEQELVKVITTAELSKLLIG